MPSITGRLEITLSVRDPQRSAAWYSELLSMQQTYDHTSDDNSMRYICFVDRLTGGAESDHQELANLTCPFASRLAPA